MQLDLWFGFCITWLIESASLQHRKEDEMRSLSLKTAAFLMIFILAIVGCSKDESTSPTSPSNQNNDSPPAFEAQGVTIPDELAQSQDPMAQQAVAYIMMANAFTSYTGFLTPPSGTEAPELSSGYDGPPWVFTWDVDDGANQYTVILTINETSTSYTWSVTVDGVLEGVTLDNFVYIEGEQAKDEKSGSITVHDPETQGVALTVNWNIDSSNVYHLVYEAPEEGRIEITVNPDESGSVTYYEWNGSAFVMVFKAVWNTDGSGEWWTYENGVQTGHGTWS